MVGIGPGRVRFPPPPKDLLYLSPHSLYATLLRRRRMAAGVGPPPPNDIPEDIQSSSGIASPLRLKSLSENR